MKHTRALAALTVCVLSMPALADISLPRLLSDGAILQRDKPLTLWGDADPGEQITLSVNGETVASGQAAANGRWRLTGSSYSAGGPYTLVLEGNNRITLNDVYFGDVWLASGQSNMEMAVNNVKEKYADAVASSANPLIRQFKVPKVVDYKNPQTDFPSGDWVAADPDSVLNFSAAAYFFARDIHANTKIPIGIINASFGGATAEAWMSLDALEDFPHYWSAAVKNTDANYVQQQKAADQANSRRWYNTINKGDKGLNPRQPWYQPDTDTSDWPTITLPGYWPNDTMPEVSGSVWLSKTIELPREADAKPAILRLGRIVDADTVYINGVEVGNTTYQYPQRIYQVPPFVLSGGNNIITVRVITNNARGGFVEDKPYALEVIDESYALSGEWRYQIGINHRPIEPTGFWDFLQPLGMYNAMLSPLLPMQLAGVIWYQGESNVSAAEEYKRLFPAMIRNWRESFNQGQLPFVFVQLPGYGDLVDEPADSAWAEMREAQTYGLSEPNTAMAVAIDTGDWNDIHPLDKKIIGERMALAARKLVYGETRLAAEGPAPYQMQINEGKAVISVVHAHKGLTSDGPPDGFAIAGADGNYVWAEAKIDAGHLVVWSDDIAEPVSVRYAWADYPHRANVYNGAGLPLMPFSLYVGEFDLAEETETEPEDEADSVEEEPAP